MNLTKLNRRRVQGLLWRCLLGALGASIGAVLQWVLWPWVGPSRFILFYPTVIATALIGGLPAGIMATAVGALEAVYFFFPPIFHFKVEETCFPVLAFSISSISISILGQLLLQRRTELEAPKTDITKHKLIEEQLRFQLDLTRKITDTAAAAIFVLDKNAHTTFINPEAQRIFGFSLEELYGESLHDKIHHHYPDGRPLPASECPFVRLFEKGAPLRNQETVFFRKDGSAIPVISSNAAIISDGNVVGAVFVVYDITERKQIETDLHAAIASRDEFLSIASHELKTPLTALHLQLQLMVRIANKEPADNKHLAVISSRAFAASQQLVRLLDELLDITRIRAGKLLLDNHEVDLSGAVIEGAAAVSEAARQKGSLIRVKADQPVLGMWDPARINQIIANLLSNAIKYGEGKPIEVTVIADKKMNRAKLLVRDQGLGISREMQSKIFERFERAVPDSKISGLGLGLYIVRQIVKAHGGSIRVESTDKGSLFIVELPLKRD